VREQDQINPLEIGEIVFAVRIFWIRQPRIDHENVSGRRYDFKSGLSVPSELRLRNHVRHQTENGRTSNFLFARTLRVRAKFEL
jgi:hypothetical protein